MKSKYTAQYTYVHSITYVSKSMQIATKHEFIHIPIAIAYEMPFFYFYRYVMVECSTFLCYFLCQPMLQAHICTILEKRRIKIQKK